MMQNSRLRQLRSFGQSVWLDFLNRQILLSDQLEQLIEEDGVTGVTSNPAIFEKAIAESQDYDHSIHTLAIAGKGVEEIYESIVVEDVRQAADLLRPVYDRSKGEDGFVSLEVSPHLARDPDGTILEARRLWQAVDRPNLMIKVPGTREAVPAIRQLLGEGININITLLFGLPEYREVANAYIEALEDRVARGETVTRIASVASFFLSRIDVLVDSLLDKVIEAGGPRAQQAAALHGRVAIASAKVAYQIFEEIFASNRFGQLAGRGAHPQRLLWASTSTKNPSYPDTMYVEPLIGPKTITTLPMETVEAYRDHGQPAFRLKAGLEEAHRTLQQLADVGIDLNDVAQRLEDDGIQKFIAPFDRLMQRLKKEQAIAMEAIR